MSTVDTFRLFLEPDRDIPQFKRLAWERTEVSIRDVLLCGVHPWMGPDKHTSLEEVLVDRLNKDAAKPAGLFEFGLAHNVGLNTGYYSDNTSRFERVLANIRETVYFVDGFGYLDAIEVAKRRLAENWNHATALSLAEKAYRGFQELRQFLKSKDKRLKLSGYDDIARYDLGRVLSLDEFADHDALIIAEGIPTPNFRNAESLRSVTDDKGRLRLVPELRHLTMTALFRSEDPRLCGVHLMWHVARSGNHLTFHPDVGGSTLKRAVAEEFATRWRTDRGRLVFQTSMDRIEEMIAGGAATPSFPRLNYRGSDEGQTATAEVAQVRVESFYVGAYPTNRLNGEQLKEVLGAYGVPKTGNKDELVRKLAALAAAKYAEKQQELDAYFSKNRFVLVGKQPAAAVKLRVLEDVPKLHNLLLAMYALRHLRGSAILDTGNENTTYTTAELAQGLVAGSVTLQGAFVSAAGLD